MPLNSSFKVVILLKFLAQSKNELIETLTMLNAKLTLLSCLFRVLWKRNNEISQVDPQVNYILHHLNYQVESFIIVTL
jgi:hypothetical protein